MAAGWISGRIREFGVWRCDCRSRLAWVSPPVGTPLALRAVSLCSAQSWFLGGRDLAVTREDVLLR